MGRGAAALLRHKLDGLVRAYTDLSAAFLYVSTRLCSPGGRVALVQPRSFLVAKDARAIREGVLRAASLTDLWVSNDREFEGVSAFTCAPTLQVSGPRVLQLRRSMGSSFEPLAAVAIDCDDLARAETWGHLAAAARGIPEVALVAGREVADYAVATADFRDQYYGLEGFLVEDADLSPAQRADFDAFPPLVTTGLIDLATCAWGRSRTRVLKASWRAPRIDRLRMERDGELGDWISARLVPKLILATQTKVIEVFADPDGRYVPSLPLVSVMPRDPSMLWRLGAGIASPVCTAVGLYKYGGAALTVDALKLSASQVCHLPMPGPDSPQLERAAQFFQAASDTDEEPARLMALRAMGEAALRAIDLDSARRDELMVWWWARLTRERGTGLSKSANNMAL
jgi:hypothetical protein